MTDGIWWLVILLAVGAALWLLAKSRGNQALSQSKNSAFSNSSPVPDNDALQRTLRVVKQHFPDYRVARNRNHLLITKQGAKIAMITIDKKIAVGQRHLGGVPVINYHRVPNRTQLNAYLQDVG